MKSIFGRHRVRSTFYHTSAAIVAVVTVASLLSLLSMKLCLIITTLAFFIDYLAEMYDPHPDNMGPWFESHFHRVKDGGGDE